LHAKLSPLPCLVAALGVPLALALAACAALWLTPSHLWRWYPVAQQLILPCFVLCLLCSALGLYLLQSMRRLGKVQGRSREAVRQGFAHLQQQLSYLLPLFGLLALCAAGSMLSLWVPLTPIRTGYMWGGILVCMFCGGLGLWRTLLMMKAALQVDPRQINGRAVSRSGCPALWQLVDEVAEKAHLPMPDNLLLCLDNGCFVTQDELHLQNGQSPLKGCSLCLSLPYLAYLERAELASLIGHELAHYALGDTAYGLRLAPVLRAAQVQFYLLDKIDHSETDKDRKPSSWNLSPLLRPLLEYFLDSLTLAAQHFSRESELAADRVSVAAASPLDAASALLRTTTLGDVIEQSLADFLQSGGRSEQGFLQQVFAAVRSAELDPQQCLEQAQPHPFDSHPPTAQRLQALGVTPSAAMLQKAASHEPSSLLEALNLPVDGLEDDLRETLQNERDEEIRELRLHLLPAAETPPLALRERGLVQPAVLILMSLGVLSALWGTYRQWIGWDAASLQDKWPYGLAIAAVLVALQFVFVRRLVMHIKQRRTPPIRINADGIKFSNLAEILPWYLLTNVISYNYLRSHSTFEFHFTALPDTARSALGIQVSQKKSFIRVAGHALQLPDKADPQTVFERYHLNALVRTRLAELGAAADE